MDCCCYYHDGITKSNFCCFKVDYSVNLIEKQFQGVQGFLMSKKMKSFFMFYKVKYHPLLEPRP